MPSYDPSKYAEWEKIAKQAAMEASENKAPGQGLKGKSSLQPAPFNPRLKDKPMGGPKESDFKGRSY